MSHSTSFRCQTFSDAKVLLAVRGVSEELQQDPEHVVVSISALGFGLGDCALSELDTTPHVQFARDRDTATWDGVTVSFTNLPGLSLSISRDRDKGDDRIGVSYGGSDLVAAVTALDAIQQHFPPRNQSVALEHALGPELAEFYRLREDTLSHLESVTRKLLQETHDYRIQLDNELAERKRTLTASFNEGKHEADAEYKKRDADLQEREQDLENRRRELDDRSARHARRDQSRALQEKISDRSTQFRLTAETRKKRWPVHTIFVLLLAASGSVIVRSLLFTDPVLPEELRWLEAARLPLGLLGFGLTSVFYIRWNDLWFRQHADQEFRLQQLALDVDRAGYAVEMLLEWEDAEKGEMPSVMLDRLTTGLFTDQRKAERARHPAEDVTSALLKVASQASVNVPGVGEVTLTGSGLRKLDRKLQKRDKEQSA